MGMIINTPKASANQQHDREEPSLFGMQNQVSGNDQREGENPQIDDVLALVGNRPLRQKLLQLAGGHQATGERERAENDLQPQHRHREPRYFGCLQIVFRRANERDTSAPKAWLSAVRCGTAVICTMPNGTPMIEPRTRAMAIHRYSTIPW